MSQNLGLGKRRGSSTRYYCLARISGVNNEEKGKFVPEFLFWLENIPSCEAHKHCRAEIAQYGL